MSHWKRQPNLMGSGELGLIVGDSLDLRSGGALGIEAVGNPLGGELLREFDANDTLAHAEHLGVVAEDRALDGERVVGGHGPDAGHLVGGNGDAEASAADEEAAVSLAVADELGSLDGGVGVGGLVGGRVDAHVDDGFNEGALLEVGFDGVLVGNTGLVAGHDDADGLHVGHFGMLLLLIGLKRVV